jgi:hypothetical protein
MFCIWKLFKVRPTSENKIDVVGLERISIEIILQILLSLCLYLELKIIIYPYAENCRSHVLTLVLTTGSPIYVILIMGAWLIWPISRGCLLLHGTWPHLYFCQCPCWPKLDFGIWNGGRYCIVFRLLPSLIILIHIFICKNCQTFHCL